MTNIPLSIENNDKIFFPKNKSVENMTKDDRYINYTDDRDIKIWSARKDDKK